MSQDRGKSSYRPVLGLALVSLVLCGLFFPLLVTALAQVLLPYQANGELVRFNGHDVGSNLIAQNFTSSVFFHSRNGSASGVDPDITVQDAYLQAQRIHDSTGIPLDSLRSLVDRNVEASIWISGSPYVNVLRLNLAMIAAYPSVYSTFN